MGETGVVCSSVSANSAKTSREVVGVLILVGLGPGGSGGRISEVDGVGVGWALRAWRALRKYSDLGASEYEAARVTAGLAVSGVDGGGGAPRDELHDEAELDMFEEMYK